MISRYRYIISGGPEINMSQFPLSTRSRHIKTLDIICRIAVYGNMKGDTRLIGQALNCIKLMRRVIITVLQQYFWDRFHCPRPR